MKLLITINDTDHVLDVTADQYDDLFARYRQRSFESFRNGTPFIGSFIILSQSQYNTDRGTYTDQSEITTTYEDLCL